ncbi:hypothetical protein K431DRAFT_46980 [Polychaeton citri CBS 116435]|uniref:Uncharacterized protein n=1 Tax=Polychaeton citri CBS 116435 TaxID=1314669 RepID=A0A9P4QAE4_9PEZI|nr:hypothetical protein K431DRAFT_46980 [Polychaeton citri CBS 116435]
MEKKKPFQNASCAFSDPLFFISSTFPPSSMVCLPSPPLLHMSSTMFSQSAYWLLSAVTENSTNKATEPRPLQSSAVHIYRPSLAPKSLCSKPLETHSVRVDMVSRLIPSRVRHSIPASLPPRLHACRSLPDPASLPLVGVGDQKTLSPEAHMGQLRHLLWPVSVAGCAKGGGDDRRRC